MRFDFTYEIFEKVFQEKVYWMIGERVVFWMDELKPIYKLEYGEENWCSETLMDSGFYGYVEGDEAHINWFVLRWM